LKTKIYVKKDIDKFKIVVYNRFEDKKIKVVKSTELGDKYEYN